MVVTDRMIQAGHDIASEMMNIQLEVMSGLGGHEAIDLETLTPLGKEYYDRLYVKQDNPQSVEFMYRAMEEAREQTDKDELIKKIINSDNYEHCAKWYYQLEYALDQMKRNLVTPLKEYYEKKDIELKGD